MPSNLTRSTAAKYMVIVSVVCVLLTLARWDSSGIVLLILILAICLLFGVWP